MSPAPRLAIILSSISITVVPLIVVAVTVVPVSAGEPPPAPAFPYDREVGARCLREILGPGAGAPAVELRSELATAVDEVLAGHWSPLYCDYSASQAGGVGPAEWAFLRPGDEILALTGAAPYLDEGRRAKVRSRILSILETSSPAAKAAVDATAGKPRSIRKTPRPPAAGIDGAEARRLLFLEAYPVWAFAHAFDAWAEARRYYEELKGLRGAVEARGDLVPAWKPEHAGPLTRADAGDPDYRFLVLEALLSGQGDNYGYHGARRIKSWTEEKRPIFPYAKVLSSLVGYRRLAERYDDAEEAKWAEEAFHRIAARAFGDRAAPLLWSDPDLAPEVGRLLREHAGTWLDELARSPNAAELPGYDWSGKKVEGVRLQRIFNPHTWYNAWGGQGEGVRPRTVLGAFLVQAYLFRAPAGKLAEWRDIPWCPADLYYVRKLVVCIEAAEGAR
jgi:hypothetical protein